MQLSEIRSWFVEDSGRQDLVNADGSDNGANRYINAASRWLDRKTEIFRQVGVVRRTISAGDFLVKFQQARTITNVGVHTSTQFKGWLERKLYDELKHTQDGYSDPFTNIARGTPIYYTPAYLRQVDTEASNYSGFTDWVNQTSDWKTYNGVILLPPADQSYLVEVWGKFFSSDLVDDTDENFWTVREPSVLVMAALREIEIFYRNTQGKKDWELAIMEELYNMELDFVEDSITDIDQLEG